VAHSDSPSRRRSLNVIGTARSVGTAFGRVAPFFKTSRVPVVIIAVLAVGAGLVEAALLALIATVATTLSQGDEHTAVDLGPLSVSADVDLMLALGVGLAVLRGVMQVVLAYLPARISAGVMVDLRRRLFDAFVNSVWAVKAAERSGYFQSMMSTHINATSQSVITISNGLSAALMFVTMIASAFVLSLPAALGLTVASLLLFVALLPLARRLRSHAKALSTETVEFSNGVQEVVLIAEETQVFGATPAFRSSFYSLLNGVRAPMLRTRFLAGAVPALYQSMALLFLVLGLAAVSLIGTAQLATLGAVVLILIRALTWAQQVQSALTTLDERIPFMNRLADCIETYDANPQQDGGSPLPTAFDAVDLDQVTFAYPDGTPVLLDISFRVERGQAIGIVGPSGSGKSSLVQLLLRLREPTEGELRVNGEDARQFSRAEWQRRVSYVPQTPQLIWGTVADNIRFYREHLTDEQVERAARRAHIHDEILSWPDGYQTVVGQRVAAVSGGQRQRLCLARALAEEPEVLVLDEPTSALDVKSEAAVQQSLEELKGEVTMFLVGHRLSTISFCDRVLVVTGGRVEAFATIPELTSTNDFYRQAAEITRGQSMG
jgi:ABC-type multidrug transport system fused ATPase/permease subunit